MALQLSGAIDSFDESLTSIQGTLMPMTMTTHKGIVSGLYGWEILWSLQKKPRLKGEMVTLNTRLRMGAGRFNTHTYKVILLTKMYTHYIPSTCYNTCFMYRPVSVLAQPFFCWGGGGVTFH